MAIFNTGYGNFSAAATSGTGQQWFDPTDALTENSIESNSTSPANTPAFTQDLSVTNLSAGIKTGSLIKGITCKVRRFYDYSSAVSDVSDNKIVLLINGVETGDNKSTGSAWNRTSYENKIFGSATDLWSIGFKTDQNINASDFGVRIKAYLNAGVGASNFCFAEIDYFGLDIHYNPTGMFMAM